MNPYKRDAIDILRKTSRHLVNKLDRVDGYTTILMCAVGFEKLLKGLLLDINPIYIYKNQEFKNTALVVYSSRIKTNTEQCNELAKKPNNDVLSFRSSLWRAIIFYDSLQNHKQFLYWLAGERDIIAHKNCSQLNLKQIISTILSNYHDTILDICTESGIDNKSIFAEHSDELLNLASKAKNTERIQKAAQELISTHNKIWEDKNLSQRELDLIKGRINFARTIPHPDSFWLEHECPACGNTGMIKVGSEQDEDNFFSFGVDGFYCLYCDIAIEDYDLIKYFDFDRYVAESYAECQYDKA